MDLKDHVVRLPFVGPTYAKRLEKLGITTIDDLIFHFPFRYDDFSLISLISRLQVGETVTVCATIEKFSNTFTKTGKKIQIAEISDSSGKIEAVFFNQMFLYRVLKKGEKFNFSGKVEWFGHKKALISPEYEKIVQSYQPTTIHTGRLVPIYNETYGISSKWLRSRIKTALDALVEQVQEFLPEEQIKNENLMGEAEAIEQIHFPEGRPSAESARYRLAFDELFLIQLASLIRKKEWGEKILGKQFFIDFELSTKFVENLPFSLTNAQKRCIKEILLDLQKNTPMNRLLQGDVGSGKTVVAALAAYTAFLNQSNTLIMAPTEILANQHFNTLKSLLAPFDVPIELVTGSTRQKTRGGTKVYEDSKGQSKDAPLHLCTSAPKVIVGTHALLYQEYDLEKVGLVIVDEQHRFGVKQRKLIAEKGKSPHFLTMTATPIPRTITLTMYNDLDLSVIDEMPPGRIAVKTWVVPNEKRHKAYDWIRSRVKDTQEQAFVICPFIEQSETLISVKAATKEFETLSKEVFPDLRLALIHGRVKPKEKNKILSEFKEGKYHILIATPIVEVGIDIPKATIMMVEGAEHFGLAQLHQLRGRVGRSNLQSYCLLFTEHETPAIINRLKVLEKTNIGMKLAETDLKIRGPGEIYGTAQHGFADLRVASFTDLALIQKTRLAAIQLLTSHFSLLTPNSALKNKLEKYRIDTANN